MPLYFPAHTKNALRYLNPRPKRMRLTQLLMLRKEKLLSDEILKNRRALKKRMEELKTNIENTHEDLIQDIELVKKDLIDNRVQAKAAHNDATEPTEPDEQTLDLESTGLDLPIDTVTSTVKIVNTDPAFAFQDSFRREFLTTLYTESSKIYTFGEWYFRLKRMFYDEDRYRRKFKIQNNDTPNISFELLQGILDTVELVTVNPATGAVLTDLQSAMCIMWAFYTTVRPDVEIPPLAEAIRTVPLILTLLIREIRNSNQGFNLMGAYGFNDKNLVFYTPQKQRYDVNTFKDNSILQILYRVNAIQHLPSDFIGANMRANLDVDLNEDWLFRVTTTLLRNSNIKKIPIFSHEQYYLRAGLYTVAALIFIQQILDSESMFNVDSHRRFDISLFTHDRAPTYEVNYVPGDNIKNFEYLWEKYVIPTYLRDPSNTTVSTLFPGVVLLGIHVSELNGWLGPGHVIKHQSNVVSLKSDKIRPLYNYLLLHHGTPRQIIETLKTHDQALFYFENGINILLNKPLMKEYVFKLTQRHFNAGDIYELCYFFVLGFLPLEFIV